MDPSETAVNPSGTVAVNARLELIGQDGQARAGVLHTEHASVPTPHFMPVATQATVKAMMPEEVAATGTRMLIMNTYHLWLRPGSELIQAHGGLHEFSHWPHAIATDSGGYQAFSLAQRVRVEEEGFEFSSHLDGQRLFLSPEAAMRIQGQLGSDVALQLDICPPAGAPFAELELAVERTTRWAVRCLKARAAGQALFGIVQGGLDLGLRKKHAREIERLDFDGLALGGFSVGEPPEAMHAILSQLVPDIDPKRTRYLMGVGTPADLIRAIAAGVDLFDCVLPTRNARNGQAFTSAGKIVIKNSRYQHDAAPLDAACECPTCSVGYTRAYLRHLYLARELNVYRLLTQHNLHFYAELTRQAREAILRRRYGAWATERLRVWSES